MTRCEIELELPPEGASRALAEAAEEWEGHWTPESPDADRGGRLALPVLFGLRRGVAVGKVEIVRLGDERSRLVWTLEESHLELHRAAVVILLVAAVPLAVAAAWPFHPPLAALLPFAAVAGLSAWWLVVSRLRSRGPHEFFEALAVSGEPARDPSAGIVPGRDPLG